MRDMLGRGQALDVERALQLILASSVPSEDKIPSAEVPLLDAMGRVLSLDVVSPEDLPGFERSTMDGYAVSSKDTFGASESSPAYLELKHEIFMGQAPDFELLKGSAAKIATGGMLPRGADAVVMFEYVHALDEGMVEVSRAVAPGENVVRRGEDVSEGQTLLKAGRVLRPQDVAVMAGTGLTAATVYERPVVSIISTGDEVVPAGSRLKPGQVRDTNSFLLAGLIQGDGGTPRNMGILKDESQDLSDALDAALKEASMVLITGGSSVGTRDVTERVIASSGKVLFHSVALKPGKPMLAGVVSGKPVLGLPGHPRAVAVCYEVFVRPLLHLLCGRRSDGPSGALAPAVFARLTKGVHSPAGRQEVLNVSLELKDGELWATPLLGKSGLLSMLVRAHGTISVPVGTLGHEQGEQVRVRLLL